MIVYIKQKGGGAESKAFDATCFLGEPRDGFKPKAYYLERLHRIDEVSEA